jgi:cysteine desulfurase
MVYLDNAATTPMDPEVIALMSELMKSHYGNPSSIHTGGRQSRALIETARRTIAAHINAQPGEIFFTSGGTEADNTALFRAIDDLGIKHVISSEVEHHAVTHSLEYLEKQGRIRYSKIQLDQQGNVKLSHLEELLKESGPSMVSLMHANNEIGNLLPVEQVGEMCRINKAYFHSDTVQTIGHYPMDVKKAGIHFLACAAHKFHGPKGVGFIYVSSDVKIQPFIHGGAQERNMRGGTENLHAIAGMAKALDIAMRDYEEHHKHIAGIKAYMIDALKIDLPGVSFNGASADSDKSLYTVLNVHLPATPNAEMLLFSLDINGVMASGGSACSSGSNQGSHVLRALGIDQSRPSVRFSFSKYTTKEDIDKAIDTLKICLGIKST